MIVRTIVAKMEDKNEKVSLAACESIYNVIKVYRLVILQSHFFEKIFELNISLIGSPSKDVSDFAKKVDEKIKDTVFACLTTK